MKPIECDVFSSRDLHLEGLQTFNGNLYVDGNLYLADPSIPLEDFDETYAPVELFGDVFVNGCIFGNAIIIHGNLECNNLDCNSIIVDGNITVTERATAIELLHSTNGDIHCTSADTTNLIANEGSIHIEEDLTAFSVKALDTLFVGNNFIDVTEIVTGSTVTVNGYIETSGGGYINIQVLSGGFHHS